MENSIIISWITAHYIDLCIVAVAIAAIAFIRYLLIKKGNWATVRSKLFKLILEAEKEFGEKTGEIKLKEVIYQFRRLFPTISPFVSDEVLEVIIKQTVEWLNDYLEKHSADLDSLENNLTKKMLAENG